MSQRVDLRSVVRGEGRNGMVHDLLAGTVLAVGWMSAGSKWGWLAVATLALILAIALSATVAVLVEGELRLPRLVAVGTSWSAWVIAAVGVCTAFAWTGLLALLALGAASALARFRPPQAHRPGGTRPGRPPVTSSPLGHGGSEPDVVVLDDEELCRAWRASYHRVGAATSPATRLAVVRRRQEYLDELQLRHPEAFSKWLGNARSAWDDPLPYIRQQSRRQ